MFRFFLERSEKKSNEKPLSFLGVASNIGGQDFDVDDLLTGKFDQQYKDNALLFHLETARTAKKKFTKEKDALRDISRCIVTKNSAYVLGLNCLPEEIENCRLSGHFSRAIIKVVNADTKQEISCAKNIEKEERRSP